MEKDIFSQIKQKEKKKVIPLKYYQNPDTLFLGKDLIGKYLMTKIDGKITGGMIVETEVYLGEIDRASHAYNGRKTKRTAVMYEKGGIAYVYLCYGIHNLFNIITNVSGHPHAILIRAIRPEVGLQTMLKRRHKTREDKTLTAGPGTLTQALGISTLHNGTPLNSKTIWLEDRGVVIDQSKIAATPRIGIDYAGIDAHKHWRYYLSS